MTLSEFRVAYPEFEAASDELVENKLDAASRRLNESAWGDRYDDAHGMMAAHLLWDSPRGSSMRLDGGDQEKSSRYLKAFALLRKEVVPSSMVV